MNAKNRSYPSIAPLHITHNTLTTCLGAGLAANWQAIAQHGSGLKPCAFETVSLPTYIGEVSGVDAVELTPEFATYECRNNRLAELALQQDSFLDAIEALKQRFGAARIGVFIGTSTAGILQTELAYRQRDEHGFLPQDFAYAQTHNTYSVADYVRRRCGLQGPAWVISSACSSGGKVFGNAQRMIAAGLIDAAIVGGVDSLCLTTLYGFASLELTAPTPCQPYGAQRCGISIGEAAGFSIVQRMSEKPINNAQSLLLLAVGESSDAHHMSSPQPQGFGALAAMQSALDQAGLLATDIDYVNLHGTSTPSNDAAEDQAMTALFACMPLGTPCSSTKAATGHTLGAAGAIEAIICALALQHQTIPAGVHTQVIDSALKSNYVLRNQAASLRYVMSNSFGFGGSNCSLILMKGQA
jgi:3-oxoacyl-[acyl-carrier-protein] synthase I